MILDRWIFIAFAKLQPGWAYAISVAILFRVMRPETILSILMGAICAVIPAT
jgi:hypothetical protein